MPGGKGKIKPEEGKQFSTEYQPDEKWTENNATQLGQELIDWQKEKDGNIFFEDFLIIQKDLYPQLISYLSEKYTSFSKLIERARKIQEIKLKRLGTADVLNATMTKFVLTNDHGWKDKTESEQRVKIVEPITGIAVSKK